VIVFVHGVPETSAIWDSVRRRIERESVALSLPGFGNPRPAGFGATKDDYLHWLLAELDGIEGPIDLVGHDWGAILACRVAHAHGDRLRSYAFDCANVSHPDYEWHAFAQVWQTPGDGEAFFEDQAAASVDDRAAGLAMLGVPVEGAREMAAASDADMGGCILDLYRSATPNPHHHWGPLAPSPAAGLVLWVANDPFAEERMSREVATALGAEVAVLDGPGHFWPYEDPDAGAAALEGFWARLEGA
jgi:pimeloyl-ACP methyl ester carboxylesterase